jgi:hypothetical protein
MVGAIGSLVVHVATFLPLNWLSVLLVNSTLILLLGAFSLWFLATILSENEYNWKATLQECPWGVRLVCRLSAEYGVVTTLLCLGICLFDPAGNAAGVVPFGVRLTSGMLIALYCITMARFYTIGKLP